MEKELVIVIDPGHGGTEGGADNGASYDGITERYINITTAKAMYEELSSYEGVTVYLTHDDPDIQMSLKERAEFAKSVNADYLISIHYNASDEHIFYGSEVWVPASGSGYVTGYQMGTAILDEFHEIGLLNRGVKTKVNADGSDYYGIIRESKSFGITGIIVEHCYLDQEQDLSYRDSEEDYIRFGIADATGIAKSLGLSSVEKGVDYSSYLNVDVPIPETIMHQDLTPPNECVVQLEHLPVASDTIDLIIRAYDEDSALIYYSYSLDGGATFSNLLPWEDSVEKNTMHVSISGITTSEVELVIKVYNQYNLGTASGVLSVQCAKDETAGTQNEGGISDYENTQIQSQKFESNTTASEWSLKNLSPVIPVVIITFVYFIFSYFLFKKIFKNRSNRK